MDNHIAQILTQCHQLMFPITIKITMMMITMMMNQEQEIEEAGRNTIIDSSGEQVLQRIEEIKDRIALERNDNTRYVA